MIVSNIADATVLWVACLQANVYVASWSIWICWIASAMISIVAAWPMYIACTLRLQPVILPGTSSIVHVRPLCATLEHPRIMKWIIFSTDLNNKWSLPFVLNKWQYPIKGFPIIQEIIGVLHVEGFIKPLHKPQNITFTCPLVRDAIASGTALLNECGRLK